MANKVTKSDEEWRQQLTSEQYAVCRGHATEPAFTGTYWNNHEPGVYRCVACSSALFSADAKFDSGSGWPSFFASLDPEGIGTQEDHSLSMRRIEIHCNACGSHLGHLFTDGPRPTGLRYCVNSVSLKFEPKDESEVESS